MDTKISFHEAFKKSFKTDFLIFPYFLFQTISNTSYREMVLVYRFSGLWLWHPAWMYLLMLPGWQVHMTSQQEVMEMRDLALSTRSNYIHLSPGSSSRIKTRRAARLPPWWCEYITVHHLMRRLPANNIPACQKFYNLQKK